MIVKFLHLIGLTNLSDSDVEKYYQMRKDADAEEHEEQSNLGHATSEDARGYRPVFGVIVVVLLIFSFAVSKCGGIIVPKPVMQQQWVPVR
jgi:hypothetical protein